MKRPTVGIATDGAHSTKERLTRYRAVDLSSGLELFNHSIGNKTNNIGEFLAIVEAIKYILRHPEAPRIYYRNRVTLAMAMMRIKMYCDTILSFPQLLKLKGLWPF